jgi:hypothetical protein
MSYKNFIEVKITVKDESQKLEKKFPLYIDNLSVNREDPSLKEMVENTIADFKGDQEDIDYDVIVNIKYTW